MNDPINHLPRLKHWYLNDKYMLAVSIAVWCAPIGFCLGMFLVGILGANHHLQFLVGTLTANVLTTLAIIQSLQSQTSSNRKDIPWHFNRGGDLFSPGNN